MKVLSFPRASPMNNSQLCNILEVGSRVALGERLGVFGECSQVGNTPGVTGQARELVATASKPQSTNERFKSPKKLLRESRNVTMNAFAERKR